MSTELVNSANGLEKSVLSSAEPADPDASQFEATAGHRNVPKQVRRTRGSASQKKNRGRGGANGHVHGEPYNSSPPQSAKERSAASDDAHGAPAAVATTSAVAGADREACAEVACAENGGKAKTCDSNPKAAAAVEEPRVPSDLQMEKISPGSEYLPDDGPGFVDEMHARVDLWEVGKKLLHSLDEKIAKATWDRLMEMRYGKNAMLATEEPPRFINDLPRPVRE